MNPVFAVQGPAAFSRSAPYLPLAHTLMEGQLLQQRGWRVVPLAWWEWALQVGGGEAV